MCSLIYRQTLTHTNTHTQTHTQAALQATLDAIGVMREAWSNNLLFSMRGVVPSFCITFSIISMVSQNRLYAPYMTACLVISLPKVLYIQSIYII